MIDARRNNNRALCLVTLIWLWVTIYLFCGSVPASAAVKTTINMASSIALAGADVSAGSLVLPGIEFLTWWINQRGGIKVAGQTYNVSFSYLQDDSSAGYDSIIYKNFATDPNVDVMIAPWGSQWALPASRAAGVYNKTFVIAGATSSALYSTPGPFPYIYSHMGLSATEASVPIQFLANLAANPPLSTVAVLARPDPFSQSFGAGVYATAAAKNLTIVWDGSANATFPQNSQTDAQNYAAVFASMPDNVDLLAACGTPNDWPGIIAGLKASGKLPKIPLWGNLPDETNPSLIQSAENWVAPILWHSDFEFQADFPEALFYNTSHFMSSYASWAALNGITAAANDYHASVANAMELMNAGLSRAASLNADDIRASMKALNITTFLGPLYLHPTKQYNLGFVVRPYQAQNGEFKAVRHGFSDGLRYPVQWSYTHYDDSLSVGVIAAILTIAGLLLAFGFFLVGVIVNYRQEKLFKSSSVNFSILTVAGCMINIASIILFALPPSSSVCVLRWWIPVLGTSVLLGCVFCKVYRIWRIFENPRMKVIKLRDVHLFSMVGAIVAVSVLLLFLYTFVPSAGMSVQTTNITTDRDFASVPFAEWSIQTVQYRNCFTSNTFDGIIIGFLGSIVVVVGFLAFRARNVPDEFNESQYIAMAVYNMGFCACICIPLDFLFADATSSSQRNSQFIIRAIGLVFGSGIILCAIFLPKLYVLYLTIVGKSLSAAGFLHSTAQQTHQQQNHTQFNNESKLSDGGGGERSNSIQPVAAGASNRKFVASSPTRTIGSVLNTPGGTEPTNSLSPTVIPRVLHQPGANLPPACVHFMDQLYTHFTRYGASSPFLASSSSLSTIAEVLRGTSSSEPLVAASSTSDAGQSLPSSTPSNLSSLPVDAASIDVQLSVTVDDSAAMTSTVHSLNGAAAGRPSFGNREDGVELEHSVVKLHHVAHA